MTPEIVRYAGFVLLLLLASPAWAASVCYDETFYPSVASLERTPTGFRALLGGKFFADEEGTSRKSARPVLKYSEGRGWERDQPFFCKEAADCLPKEQRGKPPVPSVTLSKAEATALRPRIPAVETIEQEIGAWTYYGGAVWFGISFYSGEGTSGVGGIGRHDPKSGSTVIRRPTAIRDSSIDHAVHDGQWLWLSTTGHYECIGDPPTHGLVRYDWNADRLETFEGKDDGPCGFVVHDLLLEAKYLWVATDLGLSRWDRRARRWAHYVPEPAASPPMRPTTCAALYTQLLKSLPRTQQDFGSFYSQLFDPLKRFRPRFLASYVKTMRPADWRCDELRFLGERAPDFRTLKTEFLSRRPVGSPDFVCLLEGFGEKKSRDPAWRDLLLAVLARPEEYDVLYLLEAFPGDAKVGSALVHRLRSARLPWQEAELLPTILGRTSVPFLIEAIDRFKDAGGVESLIVVGAVVEALVRATGVSLAPDGGVTPVPAGADPETYRVIPEALPHVAAQWKKWWGTHKREY